LASWVFAGPVSSLPGRPAVSRGTTGTPIASMAMESFGTGRSGTTLPASAAACSLRETASTSPRAAATRSTALVWTGMPSQRFQVLPALGEGFLAPHPAHQAAHPGTERGPDDVEVSVLREEARATRRTVVVGPPDLDGAEQPEDRLAPGAEEGGLMVLAAGEARPLGAPRIGVEELLQQAGPHLVPRGPEGPLGRLQVQVPEALPVRQGPPDEPVFFLRDFLLNRPRNCFFSAARAGASATTRTGRRSQIRSLTSTSSVHSRTKFR